MLKYVQAFALHVLIAVSLSPTLAISSRGSGVGAGSLAPLQPLGRRACDADAAAPRDPKAWEVEHVLAFLERLRPRFRDRTDLYRELFTDNDIDGAVLLGLNEDKLEKASGPAPSAASV
jgi:hypothetical protein